MASGVRTPIRGNLLLLGFASRSRTLVDIDAFVDAFAASSTLHRTHEALFSRVCLPFGPKELIAWTLYIFLTLQRLTLTSCSDIEQGPVPTELVDRL